VIKLPIPEGAHRAWLNPFGPFRTGIFLCAVPWVSTTANYLSSLRDDRGKTAMIEKTSFTIAKLDNLVCPA
jgi:hypothetical protein